MFSKLRILHIEDDLVVAESIRAYLGVYNFVVPAPSLAVARQRLADSAYDLVILDKSLPDGTAMDVLPEVRAHQPGAAILLVTGDTDFLSVTQCLDLGADDYIFKSSHLVQDLLLRIPVVLANKNTRLPLPGKRRACLRPLTTSFSKPAKENFSRRRYPCAKKTSAKRHRGWV